jgi:hypothetical protein
MLAGFAGRIRVLLWLGPLHFHRLALELVFVHAAVSKNRFNRLSLVECYEAKPSAALRLCTPATMHYIEENQKPTGKIKWYRNSKRKPLAIPHLPVKHHDGIHDAPELFKVDTEVNVSD